VIVLTRKDGGVTPVVVRVLLDLPDEPEPADHVVEVAITCPSGWLRVTGWETTDVGADVAVPSGSVRVRVHWFGLAAAAELNDKNDAGDDDPETLRLDVAPGDAGEPRVLRTWREWVAPVPESRTPSGNRLFAGHAAAANRAALEPVDLSFWSPYPELFGGYVTSLWRDPVTGVRWASGTRAGYDMLAELGDDEAGDLAAQGFRRVRTYARDESGRIWSSDQIPMERTDCLNLIRPAHYEVIRSLLTDIEEITLPAGWRRIVRREAGTSRLLGEVDAVDDDSPDLFQRWRDDTSLPTS
jgi:hypothetical protein